MLHFKFRDVPMAMYYATNSWRRCGGMAVCILELGTRYSWVANFNIQLLSKSRVCHS